MDEGVGYDSFEGWAGNTDVIRMLQWCAEQGMERFRRLADPITQDLGVREKTLRSHLSLGSMESQNFGFCIL